MIVVGCYIDMRDRKAILNMGSIATLLHVKTFERVNKGYDQIWSNREQVFSIWISSQKRMFIVESMIDL